MNQPIKQRFQPQYNSRSSIRIIGSVIDELILQSKNQIRSNKLVSKCMSPFTSQKVNATINQIGKLIYEEAEDSEQSKKFHHFREVQEPYYFHKDNMFTNGAQVVFDQKNEDSIMKIDDSQSVNSFKTAISKLQIQAGSQQMQDKQNSLRNQLKNITVKKRPQTSSSSSKLISLQPQNSNQSRTSAFNRSQTQNMQQRLLEIQINEFRDQKILQEEEKKKKIEKEKKITNLLTNDQVVMTFDYNGDFIKKSKRELTQMINGRMNQKVIEAGLLLNDEKFWKSKKANKGSNQRSYTETQSSLTANNSNLANSMKSKGVVHKRTTMQKIQELKQKSILIEIKKKICASGTDQKQKRLESAINKGLQSNSFGLTSNGQKLTEEEQTKIKEHQLEFLSKKLHTYHEKQQNYMPQWIEKVQKGCKMTIFIGDGEQDKSKKKQKQKHLEKKTNRSLSDHSQRTSIKNENEQKEYLQTQNSKQNGRLGKLYEVKHLQNLKVGQMTQEEMIQEWQKRRYLKSVDHKSISGNNKGKKISNSNLKNSRSISVSEGKQLSINNTDKTAFIQSQNENRPNISNKAQLMNEKSTQLKESQKSLKQNPNDPHQDQIRSQYSFSNVNHDKTTKINLNKYEFDKLKKYLRNKNSIVKRNETLKNDGMEFFLVKENNSKQTQKIPVQNSVKSQHKMSVPTNHTAQASSNIFSKQRQSPNQINEEEEQSTINERKSLQKHRRLYTLAWKPRSFSVAERRESTCKSETKSKIKDMIDGSIRVNNEKLIHSLLRQSMDFDLSKSSILNTKRASKSRLKSSSSEIK